MSNILPGEGLRDVYVKDSGNDVNGGGNIVQSVKTLSKAVDIVGMINPPAGIFNPASIIDVGSSSYTEQLVIPDDVQVTIPACRITMDGSFNSGVLAGERSLLRIGQILTGIQGGQVGYSTNGSTRVGLTCTAIICNGDGDTGYSVDGGSSDVFCETSQIITRGENSTAISYTATGSQPRVMELNEINLEGGSSTGVLYNAGSPEVCTLKVGAITDLGGAGNVALQASGGKIACFVNEIQAETAIKVEAGAELDLFDARVDGDIVVDAGGTLNIFVLEHNGTITNNGVINGQIGSEEFGTEIKTSDDIVNNSGVTGSTVTDALNNVSGGGGGIQTVEPAVGELDVSVDSTDPSNVKLSVVGLSDLYPTPIISDDTLEMSQRLVVCKPVFQGSDINLTLPLVADADAQKYFVEVYNDSITNDFDVKVKDDQGGSLVNIKARERVLVYPVGNSWQFFTLSSSVFSDSSISGLGSFADPLGVNIDGVQESSSRKFLSQAQSDAIDNISLLYGHIGVTSDAPFTTTSDTAQLVDTWNLTLPDTDTYDVTVTVEWSLNAANQDAIFRFDVNSAVGFEINQEPKDTTNKIFFTTFALVGLQSGANTIEFFARKESGNANTLTVYSNRFTAQKIDVLS